MGELTWFGWGYLCLMAFSVMSTITLRGERKSSPVWDTPDIVASVVHLVIVVVGFFYVGVNV